MDDQIIVKRAFDDFKTNIVAFLEGQLRNSYVYGDDIITVYTRKGVHNINGALLQCFDIGTITIASDYRSQGLGMRVINHMHAINPYRCTFVESLINDQLHQRLVRLGWKSVKDSVPPSVFKMTPLPPPLISNMM